MSLVPALDKVPPVYQPDQCYREEGCLCVSYILSPTNAKLTGLFSPSKGLSWVSFYRDRYGACSIEKSLESQTAEKASLMH